MSYTEIYKFSKSGDAIQIGETRNAFRGAQAIWTILEERYLPNDWIPEWAKCLPKERQIISRVRDFSSMDGVRQIWDLFHDPQVSLTDKIVLGTTFDYMVVLKDDLPRVIEAFRAFQGDTSLKEQAEIIQNALADDDLIAISWNQTSVNGEMWESDEVQIDEDGEQYYPPYNLFKYDKHNNLFEHLTEEQNEKDKHIF